MYLRLLLIIFLFGINISFAQVKDIDDLQPEEEFENVHVQKIFSDSFATTFIIWVKNEVKLHKHENHTEQVYILSGKGLMKLREQEIEVRAGDMIFIPKNTPHAVKVTSEEAMKVISIQAPEFKGEDRIWLE